MKSWVVGITIVCALVVAAWGISSVMGNIYDSNYSASEVYSANEAYSASEAYSSGEDCCGETEQTGGSSSSADVSAESDCCGSGSADGESPESLASTYYIEKTGDTDFEVVIEDLGCHQKAQIIKDGVVVMNLSINGGQVTEE